MTLGWFDRTMNFPNPTRIKVGMEATFAGKQYRVAGRAVLGIVESGQVYYWQEYNLETDEGNPATLVFEDNEEGPQWKMFTMFEPQFPISAEDAASKRTGDVINLEGGDCRVTRVDHSRVYFVEGKAPEGEVENAAADYFNAVEKGRMVVVSWTGEEVECYRGMNISNGMVATAFGLEGSDLVTFHLYHAARTAKANGLLIGLGVFAFIMIFMGVMSDTRPMRRPPAVKNFTAPSSSFELSGEGTKYRIAARTLVEVEEVGLRSQRHEYFLTNDEGGSALLIEGMQPGTKDWVLFKALSPIEAMTPQQAAKVRVGQIVNVDGVVAVVTDLFRSTVIMGEEAGYAIPIKSDEVRYGFLGRKNTTLLMVRWNANGITFRQGMELKEKEVKAGFGKAGK